MIAQLALRDFVERGELERHLRRMRSRYAARRATLLAALRRRSRGARARDAARRPVRARPSAESDDESALVARAAEAGVGLEGLGLHRFEPGGRGGLVLGYGALPSRRSSAPSTCSPARVR